MVSTDDWRELEPDLESVFAQQPLPLQVLAAGDVPAIVLRGVYSADWCHRLVGRLIGEGLLYDPKATIPEEFRELAIPEGYYREGRSGEARYAWETKTESGRSRIDIGTSLGYRGSDKEAFFDHSAETHRLFERLFADDNPIAQMYNCLGGFSS